MFSKLLVFCGLFSVAFLIGDEEILCVSSSCNGVTCDTVPSKCTTNDTSSGVYMLSPDICNCCEYCLANIKEGETCSIGDPSTAKHTSICGPGLTCTAPSGSTDGTCQKMSTDCAKEQQSYDIRRENGLLGTMETRALCDDDGLYGTYKCIPGQTCYCLHSSGSRIFGEAPYSTISNYMDCACSRAYYDAVYILGRELHPHEHFRCATDGSYDRVQCLNEQCLCVDAEDGAPTFPKAKFVEMKYLTSQELSCYTNKKQGQYYKKCEEEYMKIYKEVQQKKNESGYSLVLGYTYPNCDLDGTYSPVQENRTHKYCVDKDGNMLTEPLLKKDTEVAESVKNMDCKCVRANLVSSSTEILTCNAQNGNYEPIQCRRGICRCVDSDGNQKCADASSDATEKCQEVNEMDLNQLGSCT